MLPTIETAYAEMQTAYAAHQSALVNLCHEQTKLIGYKADLTAERGRILSSAEPKDLGGNAEQREARLAEMTINLSALVQGSERLVISHRADEEIARAQCRLCDQTLAFLQLAAGTTGGQR